MSLTEHERHSLDDLAQEITREDSALAHLLTRGGWLPRHTRVRMRVQAFVTARRWWQYLLALAMLAGVVVLLVTEPAPRPWMVVAGGAVLVIASSTLCLARLLPHRRRRGSAPGAA